VFSKRPWVRLDQNFCVFDWKLLSHDPTPRLDFFVWPDRCGRTSSRSSSSFLLFLGTPRSFVRSPPRFPPHFSPHPRLLSLEWIPLPVLCIFPPVPSLGCVLSFFNLIGSQFWTLNPTPPFVFFRSRASVSFLFRAQSVAPHFIIAWGSLLSSFCSGRALWFFLRPVIYFEIFFPSFHD